MCTRAGALRMNGQVGMRFAAIDHDGLAISSATFHIAIYLQIYEFVYTVGVVLYTVGIPGQYLYSVLS